MKNTKHLCLCVAAVLAVGFLSGCETDEAVTTSTTTESTAVRQAPVSSSVESTTVRSY